MWKKIYDKISKTSCCLAKKLSKKQEKDFYVMKFCNQEILNNIFSSLNNKTIEFNQSFVIAIIPEKNKPFVSTIYSIKTMRDVYSHFANHGFAFEGCFDIKKLTYIETPNKLNEEKDVAALLLNDLKILPYTEFIEEIPPSNIQYLLGVYIYRNWNPTISLSDMCTFKLGNKKFNGDNVSVSGDNFIINIDDKIYKVPFNTPNLTYMDYYFQIAGYTVYAIDKNGDRMIIVHPSINHYNLQILLKNLEVRDAVILCRKNNLSVIWKEDGENLYNKTDYLGDISLPSYNVITIS